MGQLNLTELVSELSDIRRLMIDNNSNELIPVFVEISSGQTREIVSLQGFAIEIDESSRRVVLRGYKNDRKDFPPNKRKERTKKVIPETNK